MGRRVQAVVRLRALKYLFGLCTRFTNSSLDTLNPELFGSNLVKLVYQTCVHGFKLLVLLLRGSGSSKSLFENSM